MPLHCSVGNKSETPSQKKKERKKEKDKIFFIRMESQGLTMLPRLVSNSWAAPRPLKVLGLQAGATPPGLKLIISK